MISLTPWITVTVGQYQYEIYKVALQLLWRYGVLCAGATLSTCLILVLTRNCEHVSCQDKNLIQLVSVSGRTNLILILLFSMAFLLQLILVF